MGVIDQLEGRHPDQKDLSLLLGLQAKASAQPSFLYPPPRYP